MIRRSSGAIFDGYVRRLLQSSNPMERNSTYWGYTKHHEYPVLIPNELLFEHVHVMGGTGTGKTALSLIPLTTQLIRRNDGPVLILDLKGDMALFHTARMEAESTNRKFKWFTNKPYRSTYVFNPWRQSYLEKLAIQEILGLFLLSLNLHHGDDYGRGFFSLGSRTLLQDCIKQCLDLERTTRSRNRDSRPSAPQSFVELEAKIRDLAKGSEEYRSGQHLLHVLQTLIDFPQLNLTGRQGNVTAAKAAIHMPEAIVEKQVIYFWLQGAMDLTSVAEIARLGLYSMLSAALGYRDETGQKPRVYAIVDEAQHLIALNIANVLAQAREHGMACILAHQSMSQLNPPGGVDLRDLVLSCTSVKQFWSARDPVLKDHISNISGEVNYYSASWSQFKQRVQRGEVGRQFAASKPNEDMCIEVSESPGPRLTSQDIEDFSKQKNTSILSIERHAGLSCFQGAFPVHMDWTMSQPEYQRRSLEMNWPDGTGETIVTEGAWPATDDGATKADDAETCEESARETETGQSVTSKLNELGRRFSKRKGNKS